MKNAFNLITFQTSCYTDAAEMTISPEPDSLLRIFMAYKARQPFSDNMLRACPIVDNPGAIKKIVEESGAKSTDLQSPEKVEDLIGKTIDVARKWKETADDCFSFLENAWMTIHIQCWCRSGAS